MTLEIISPDKLFFKGEVQIVKVPGTQGEFTILPRHAPIISTLGKGDVIYMMNGKENHLAIESGFVEVHADTITVCVEQIATEKQENA